MAVDPITALFETGKAIIERVWPDKVKQAEELRKLTELKQKGNLEELQQMINLMAKQIDANVEAAKSHSVFVAGARPFIIWVCGAGLAYSSLMYPLLCWFWSLLKAFGCIPLDLSPPPEIDGSALTSLVTGLLGLGGLRSFEKIKGVSRSAIK